MLARMEHLYLNILRVVILVAATVALIVAAFGIAGAVPLLLQKAGLLEPEVQEATLAQFMVERRPSASEKPTGDMEASAPAIHPDLSEAARNIQRYLGKRSEYRVSHWESVLTGYAGEVPSDAYSDYAASVKKLSEDLLRSTGSPLSLQRVEELLFWHLQQFRAALETRAAAEAAADAQFYLVIGAAFAAFMAFVAIVFIFLFVKIERSLRLVRTIREDAAMQETAHA